MEDEFEMCRRMCIYSGDRPLNGCDYFERTGKLRGCPAGEKCKRFVEGERLIDRGQNRPPAPVRRPKKAAEIAGYMAERTRRVAGIDRTQTLFRDK